jgi:hypothetical protein
MSNVNENIDKLISQILSEEIENKAQELSEQVEGEWMEIDTHEELHGGQKKLDVAEPKGKLTSADFKKLRSNKKTEVEENMYYDDLSDLGNYEGDEEAEEDAEELSQKEPRYRGTRFASFNDEDWFDENDYPYTGDFDFEFDEEQFDEFEPFKEKYGKKVRWFSPDEQGKTFFNRYKEKFGPLKIRIAKGLEEAETGEGNAFTDKLRKTAKGDKFTLGGKEYTDNSNLDEAKKEKWIQKTGMKKGVLHKKLGVPEGEKIPKTMLSKLKKELMKKSEGDKKLSSADSKLLKQVNLAMTLKDIKENKNVLRLTENEIIDLIESIVLEQKEKETKDNISKKEATGLKKTEKVLGKNKKENEDYYKEVVKKMTDYLKDGSKGKYDESPTSFPQGNGQLAKMDKMAYKPSEAVEEYIEAFSYPGQTNLRFDEIKPNDEKIENYLKGNKKTGNAEVDEEGNPLGNVVPSKVGERFKKNYDENLYGIEQADASYKRQPQPVDEAGDGQLPGHLSKKGKKDSANKASKILNQLESTDEKKLKIVSEEMNKMKNLISYNRKTQ